MDHVINREYIDPFSPQILFLHFEALMKRYFTVKGSDILPSSVTDQYNFIYKTIL